MRPDTTIERYSNRYIHFILVSFIILLLSGCNIQLETKSSLSRLYITTESSFIDTLYLLNRYKVPAYMVFVTVSGDTLYDNSLRYIRARGNWTFTHADKKSFRFKLNHSTLFPDLLKSKDFILLANPFDETYIHNAIAFDLAKSIGVLAPNYTYISLYFNDEYKGLYQMTNTVETVGKIYDLEKENEFLNPLPLDSYPYERKGEDWEPKSMKGYQLPGLPDDISGGYLLRYDWADEYKRMKCGFVSDGGDAVGITSPQHASLSEIAYIQHYYSEMERAIQDTTNNTYQDYLDVESFAKYYLLQELLMNGGCRDRQHVYA